MADASQQYDISELAAEDLEDIFDYTAAEFGVSQAVVYVGEFEDSFEALAANPELGRQRNEIRKGIRSLVKNSHVIFYCIIKNRVRMLRILHVSRDLIRFFNA
jgi:toxin ParE1/3/4